MLLWIWITVNSWSQKCPVTMTSRLDELGDNLDTVINTETDGKSLLHGKVSDKQQWGIEP